MASELILGLAETHTVGELDAFLKQACADIAAGVRVTSLQLEGGGGSGEALKMEPERLVGILRKAKLARADLDGGGDGTAYAQEKSRGFVMNFNNRAART